MSTGKALKVLAFFHYMNAVLITITTVGLITLFSVFFMMSFAADPVDLKLRTLTPTVKYDNELIIESSVERHEICQTTVSYAIYDSKNTKITFPEISTPAVGKLGKEISLRRIKMTKNIFGQEVHTGPAKYRLVLSWVCPGNYYQRYAFPKTHVYEDIPFVITEE